MGAVSLISVGQALGRTTGQTVNLGLLRKNGYTRTHAVDGYLRVNGFEVENGRADDPARGDSLHYLGNWDGYIHSQINLGSQLSVASSYGGADLTFTRPSGYTRAPAIFDQKAWIKDTGYSGDTPGETQTATNPFSSPDQTNLLGDGTSGSINLGAYGNNWVAIAIAATFNDSVTVREGGASQAYTVAGGEAYPLTGPADGVLVRAYAETPPSISANQLTDENTCFAGDDVTIRVSFTLEGPSTARLEQQINGGAWTLVNSSVSAGAPFVDLTIQSGTGAYKFRIRYNDVSPDSWRTMAGTVSPTCILT